MLIIPFVVSMLSIFINTLLQDFKCLPKIIIVLLDETYQMLPESLVGHICGVQALTIFDVDTIS